jgi:hypothetical protein
MGLKELPLTYTEWLPVREAHLKDNLQMSSYSADLFKQYKKHIGPVRYIVLIEGQKLVVPDRVRKMLRFGKFSLLAPVIPLYKWSRHVKLDGWFKRILLPRAYKDQIDALDVQSG